MAEYLPRGLRDDAPSPEGNAEPVAQLLFILFFRQVVVMQADAAHGEARFLQHDGVGLLRRQDGPDDLPGVFDARMRGPAGDGADPGVLRVPIAFLRVRQTPRPQDQPFRFEYVPFVPEDHLRRPVDGQPCGVDHVPQRREIRQRGKARPKQLLRPPGTFPVVFPAFRKGLPAADKRHALYFRPQGGQPVGEAPKHPWVVHQPGQDGHAAFGAFQIIADHVQDIVRGHGPGFTVPDKGMDIHAPVAVDKRGPRRPVRDTLSRRGLPDAHGAVDEDHFHFRGLFPFIFSRPRFIRRHTGSFRAYFSISISRSISSVVLPVVSYRRPRFSPMASSFRLRKSALSIN